jgi:heat shock protein HtpX
MNAFKSALLMTAMVLLLMLIGNLVGGTTGMTIALIVAGVMNFISYWFSDKIVLALYRAKEINRSEAPRLYALVEELTRKAGLPMPKLYAINTNTPNAFATGRNPEHAAVAVTTGIVKLLNEEELAGVIAHELAHIKNRDILVGTIAATLAGAITLLARMAGYAVMFGSGRDREENGGGLIVGLIMMIVAPIAAFLIQMAISRSREYMADETGAEISGKPLALASALKKLQSYNEDQPIEDAEPATAHMFIVNPLSGSSIMKLFSTHPPIEERVQKLQMIAARIR